MGSGETPGSAVEQVPSALLEVFVKTVSRALKYRITDIKTIERIATLQLTADNFQMPLPQIDRQLEKRDAYIQGYFADDVDLSVYDNIAEDNDE